MNMASVKDDKVVNAFLPREACTLLLQIHGSEDKQNMNDYGYCYSYCSKS